jgi:uncharacterized protein with NRDE domain
MCTIIYNISPNSDFPFIMLANRDEFLEREAAPMSWWQTNSEGLPVLSGKDIQAGGTWLAINEEGKIAAVTNVRDPKYFNDAGKKLSRGKLPLDWVSGNKTALEMTSELDRMRPEYSGYNFLFGSLDSLNFHSNHNQTNVLESAGLHGLSNADLDSTWPKVSNGKLVLEKIATESSSVEEIMHLGLSLMSSEEMYPDELLPSTGVSMERERILSAMCVKMPGYATRVTTIIVKDQLGNVNVLEHNHQTKNQVYFTFNLPA